MAARQPITGRASIRMKKSVKEKIKFGDLNPERRGIQQGNVIVKAFADKQDYRKIIFILSEIYVNIFVFP